MRALVKRGWHDYPDPTRIIFLVVIPRVHLRAARAKLESAKNRVLGRIAVVIVGRRDPYLNANGKIVGFSAGGGITPVIVTMREATSGRQAVIGNWSVIVLHRKLGEWEHSVEEAG
jgi:hypothetical protein